jgi:hypothetical protein
VANDDKVLSQAEIDALLAGSLKKGNATENKNPAPAPEPPVKVNAVPPPPPKAAAPAVKMPPPPVKMAPQPPMAASATAAHAHIAPMAMPTAVAHTPAAHTMAAPPQQSAPQGPTTEQIKNLCRQVIAQETKDLNKQLIELTIKVNSFESMAQKITQIEVKLDQIAATAQSSPKAVKNLGAKIDEIYGLLEAVRRPERKSDEGRIHDEFRCIKCQSEKLVAVHVKCTSCGTENWMGWFPESR